MIVIVFPFIFTPVPVNTSFKYFSKAKSGIGTLPIFASSKISSTLLLAPSTLILVDIWVFHRPNLTGNLASIPLPTNLKLPSSNWESFPTEFWRIDANISSSILAVVNNFEFL